MFGTLHYFENEDFFRENRYFFVLTPEEILVYDVLAAVEFSDDDLLRNYDFSAPRYIYCVYGYVVFPKREGGSVPNRDRGY